MNKVDMEESPYCEVCGHCGEIGCCGIRGFIEEHIKGKTNCKNEDGIVQDLISICEYETEVFKKNDTLNKGIDELITEYYKLKIVNDELLEEATENDNNVKMQIYTQCIRYIKHTIESLEKLKGE